MFRVEHYIGPFQPGEVISAAQAGPEIRRLVTIGALVPLDGETLEDLPEPVVTAAPVVRNLVEARFQALEERLAAVEEKFASVFVANGPTPLVVGDQLPTTEDQLKNAAKPGKGKLTTDAPPPVTPLTSDDSSTPPSGGV